MSVRGSAVPRRLRLGMVGGGQGAFIGAVHRMAARLDGEWELVAGALSADPARARASADDLRLDPARSYTDYAQMAACEAQRADGIDAVAVVTPNHLHAPVAGAFLQAGLHVICDKPLALDLAEARTLQALARRHDRVVAVTYNYSGYPMVRQARQLVQGGALGALRLLQVEYTQDWLSRALEADGQHKQAAWRTDPARAGAAGCLGDIGTHAYQLACFVSGLRATELCAELTRFVPGRLLDDNVHALLRWGGDVRGALWASQVAAGAVNGLVLRVHGSEAGLEWRQEQPETLLLTPAGGTAQRLQRGRLADAPVSAASRLPAGHPEGFIEAFATIYRDAAEHIRARQQGRAVAACAADMPTLDDGIAGLAFVDAALRSHAAGNRWTALEDVAAPPASAHAPAGPDVPESALQAAPSLRSAPS